MGANDLGVLGDLAKALGLVDGSDFRQDWLSNPGEYLSRMLADRQQREALVAFVDEVLGGDERTTGPDGAVWLPIARATDPDVAFFLVIDDRPATSVAIGLGVRASSVAPVASVSAQLPLFAAAKSGHTVASPLLLGTPAARATLAVDITLEAAAPVPGQAHLGGVSLTLDVPTGAGGAAPVVSIALRQLQMPGANQARDLTLSVADLPSLQTAALDLVLGLVRAQAAALPAGPLAALAGLVGLRVGSPVPPLPLAALAQEGLPALVRWFGSLLEVEAARVAWLDELAALFVTGTRIGSRVKLQLGPLALFVEVPTAPGASGSLRIAPTLALELPAAPGVQLSARAVLCSIDLGHGQAQALPSLSLALVAGVAAGGTALIDVAGAAPLRVESLRAGLGLDDQRRPVVVLAAEKVRIGTAPVQDVLDLSSPHAVAESASTVLDTVAEQVLSRLGPAVAAVRVLLGLSAPAGHAQVVPIALAVFVQDPLRAVRGHWERVLRDHRAAVPAILEQLRNLLADAARTAVPVTGTGIEIDPWRVALAGPLELRAVAGGGRLAIGPAVALQVDDLVQPGTRVATAFTATVLDIDLQGGAARFMPAIDFTLSVQTHRHAEARIAANGFGLRADHIGVQAQWRQPRGLSVELLVPGLTINLGQLGDPGLVARPLPLPRIGSDGRVLLTPAQWAELEDVFGALAQAAAPPWADDVIGMLGWAPRAAARVEPVRLGLAALLADPAAALRAWAAGVLAGDHELLQRAVSMLASLLTGTREGAYGLLGGAGSPLNPWRLPLAAGPLAAELVLWVGPHGPLPGVGIVSRPWQAWRPGMDGLPVDVLAEAIDEQATRAADMAALRAGRDNLAEGFEALILRWVGSDGRIVAPQTGPAGVQVHRWPDLTPLHLREALELNALLGRTPATVLRVAVAAAGTSAWPGVPAARHIDLTVPGLAPAALDIGSLVPAPAAGEWFLTLGGRAGCRLASGDEDGLAGQAQRLARVLAAFGGVAGGVVLVAEAAAGHAARRAAEAVAVVTDLVTLGTPAGPVSLSVIDVAPAADALRLLQRLLPSDTDDITDDADLHIGRGLVTALTELAALDDPARELRPPATAPAAPRAGLSVHMVFGEVGEDAVRRGLTAVVAAGLAERDTRRLALELSPPDSLGLSLRAVLKTPLPAAGEPELSGHAEIHLARVKVAGAGVALTTARRLRVHLELGRSNGWLVGGPDPGRAAGEPVPPQLRRLELDIDIALGGDAAAAPPLASVTLVDAQVFGVSRERWRLQAADLGALPADLAAAGLDAASTLIPEARLLVAAALQTLQGAAAPPLAALRELLRALELLDAAGGSLAASLEHLLNDPLAHLRAAVADDTRRAALLRALGTLWPPAASVPAAAPVADSIVVSAGPVNVRFVLAPAWRVDVSAAAERGPLDWIAWQAALAFDATGVRSGSVALGTPNDAPTGGLQFTVDQSLRTRLRWHRPAGAGAAVTLDELELFPAPRAQDLGAALARLLPAELTRLGIEALREASARAPGAVGPAIDALLSAVGLLGAANAQGLRRVPLPAALFADASAWLRHAAALGSGGGALAPARLVALLDALKPLIGVAGPAGTWQIATGVGLHATTDTDGSARLALALDTALFAPAAGVARLVAAGEFALSMPAGAAPRAGVAFYVGLPGGAAGRQAVHLAIGGSAAEPVRLVLRPASGADVPLFPHPAGLSTLATTAVTQALPLVLDALAGLRNEPALKGQVGQLTARLGDALALRTAAGFDADALQEWARGPAAALALRLPALAQLALTELAAAVAPLLPAGATASAAGGTVALTIGGFGLAVTPVPFAVRVSGRLTGLPAIDRARAELVLDTTGLRSMSLEAGPALIAAGGLTLRPSFMVVAGQAPVGGAPRVALTLGLPGDRLVGARWLIPATGGSRLDLVLIDATGEHTALDRVALGLLEAVLDLAASFVMSTTAVSELLVKQIGGGASAKSVEQLLRGVLLREAAGPRQLIESPFDTTRLLARLQRLLTNVAGAGPSVTIDGALTIGLEATPAGAQGSLVGVRVGLARPARLPTRGVVITIENDARWIRRAGGAVPEGIVIDLLRVGPAVAAFAFEPGISVNGLGIRVAREEKPLLEAGSVSIGSVALHVFGQVGGGPLAGGVQLQLTNLAAGVGSAGGAGGGNGVAKGLLSDTGSGSQRLAPAFSPALSIQKHGAGPVLVGLRAGDGQGPWWLAVQRGFGPIYVEQVGFGVTVRQDELESISLLLDGRVSLLGLTASVDDLQLTFTVASDASVFDPSRWKVDLAGLAFNSDLGGLTIQGGLRKFGTGDNVQYVGMLMGRFAVYGLSIYGGYGQGSVDGQKFASFFAFGAVNGLIGGPPAFFLTGIGGGLGINRRLVLPTDLSRFGEFPFIKALDPAARPSADPMADLIRLGEIFPMARGSFWFAAGVSFTSFALVDGVAVVSVQIGDGLEVALLGLARIALPRPQVALVSLELGLVARFSSKEGVLWVQAQLTDNSWLLYRDVRLTGGFAFVVWFNGPNRGQFVLTMGGFHPRFRRAGYPEVPRLGLQWRVGPFITVKGESYFALTSEAIMAGVRVEVSARFGPAWAQVVFAADGIVFFDPFHFEVEAYASISAGVTIDVWIGEITISISIGARILVAGPQFHGKATFSVGPVELEVEFGESNQPPRPLLPWGDFVRKYLEEARPDVARVLAAIPGKGALPTGAGPGGATDTGTADGSAARPFEVYAEFEITVTSVVPVRVLVLGARVIEQAPSHAIGLAPMGIGDARTELRLDLVRRDNSLTVTDRLQHDVRRAPGFPIGVWGPAQDADNPKLPTGDVIEAMQGVRLFTTALIPPGLPPIDYRRRVETGLRQPLPFVNERARRNAMLDEAKALSDALPAAADAFATGAQWMARSGASRTAVAALRGERAAPPRLGSLTDGLRRADAAPVAVALPATSRPKVPSMTVQRPKVIAVLSAGIDQAERVARRTTVARLLRAAVRVMEAPTFESVQAAIDPAIPARLRRLTSASAVPMGKTVVARNTAPLTRIARAPVAAVRGRGAQRDVRERLAHLAGALARASGRAGEAPLPGSALAAGEVLVLALPNAARDLDTQAARPRLAVTGAPSRVVALRAGGEVLDDRALDGSLEDAFVIPLGAERIAVAVGAPGFDPEAQARRLMGWHAGSILPYLGWRSALAAQAVVQSEGVSRTQRDAGLRRESGWAGAAELVAGSSLVTTRFTAAVGVLVVALDDPLGTAAGRSLSLALEGGARAEGPDGEPRAPQLVVRAQRSYLVYDMTAERGRTLAVSVASDAGWHLAGTMAAPVGTPSDAVVAMLAEDSLDALVPGAVVNGAGQAALAWLDAALPSRSPAKAARRAPRK